MKESSPQHYNPTTEIIDYFLSQHIGMGKISQIGIEASPFHSQRILDAGNEKIPFVYAKI